MPSENLTTHQSPAASLPEGQRIYAIGDSHGCDDRLARLHGMILADLAARPIDAPTLVHLGDHVDRGPDSAGVLARLMQPMKGLPAVNLLGNHDQMMLDALGPDTSPDAVELWLMNGGDAALASYGASPLDRASWSAVPAEHLAFLASCPIHFEAGDYLFVHAGIRPGVALARQSRMDMLWIREPFLSWNRRLPHVVVHGHTPAARPEIRPHRIGVDTGAVAGGDLTCAVLERDRIGFLRA